MIVSGPETGAVEGARSLALARWSTDLEGRIKALLRQLCVLEDEEPGGGVTAALGELRRGCEDLLAGLSRLTDFENEDSPRLGLGEAEFELHAVLRSAVARHVFVADERGVKLTCLVHRDIPRRVTGDAARLRQLVSIFVENAVRRTRRCELQVRISPAEGAGDGVGVRVSVAEPALTANLQAEPPSPGLVLFSELVRLLGGEVGVEEGQTAWFTVAVRPVVELAREDSGSADGQPMSGSSAVYPHHPILLVSNNADGVPAVLLALQRRGYTVELEDDRKRFPARLREREYSLVLMDADGGSPVATLATRLDGGRLRRVPIVGVPRTGSRREQIDEAALLRVVERCIRTD